MNKQFPRKKRIRNRELTRQQLLRAAVDLASEDADYITGHTLGVNGGRYCN